MDGGKRTKIVATLGPASDRPEIVEKLILAGTDLVRLNFSHGTHESIGKASETVRRVAARLGLPVAIMGDLKGPRIRLGRFPGHRDIHLERGDKVELVPGARAGTPQRIPLDYPGMLKDANPGDKILINDGLVELKVEKVSGDTITCRVTRGGPISDHKGVSLRSQSLSIPFFSAEDRDDLDFATTLGFDYIALSFVRSAADIDQIRDHLGPQGRETGLIAKIERPEAVSELPRIMDRVDGIMVARGDLAIETSIPEIPIIQKKLINAARKAGVPVITATQMLESMVEHSEPTRAEATDVANAVLDGTDAVMLSAETAVGDNPVEAVKIMSAIAGEAENSPFWRPGPEPADREALTQTEALARAAASVVWEMRAEAVIVFTISGKTAASLSRYRPRKPIYALTPDSGVARRLNLYWGVRPLVCPLRNSTDTMLETGEEIILEKTGLKAGDKVVIVSGNTPSVGSTNIIKVYTLGGKP